MGIDSLKPLGLEARRVDTGNRRGYRNDDEPQYLSRPPDDDKYTVSKNRFWTIIGILLPTFTLIAVNFYVNIQNNVKAEMDRQQQGRDIREIKENQSAMREFVETYTRQQTTFQNELIDNFVVRRLIAPAAAKELKDSLKKMSENKIKLPYNGKVNNYASGDYAKEN